MTHIEAQPTYDYTLKLDGREITHTFVAEAGSYSLVCAGGALADASISLRLHVHGYRRPAAAS